jgi:ribonuclease HII
MAVGYAEPEEIDQINILEATKLAMDRAIENLKNNFNLNQPLDKLIIDGTARISIRDYCVKK